MVCALSGAGLQCTRAPHTPSAASAPAGAGATVSENEDSSHPLGSRPPPGYNGLWTWSEKGRKAMECRCVDGQLHGTMTVWDGHGNVQCIVDFVRGKKHGRHIMWSDGRKVIEGEYKDDLVHGTWIEYMRADGGVSVEKRYEAGGPVWIRRFGGDGLIISEGTYENGKRHGKWVSRLPRPRLDYKVEYYESGVLLRTERAAAGSLFPGAANPRMEADAAMPSEGDASESE